MADYVQTAAGRVGYGLPVPYNATAVYRLRDVVQYQGGAYVALLDGVTGIAPSDDGVNYRLLCARGEQGDSNAEWFTGTAVAGRGTGIIAGVPGSSEGDMYLNSETSDVYSATAPDTWDWVMNMAEAITVTAASVPTADGSTVQEALDEHDTAIAELDARVDDLDAGVADLELTVPEKLDKSDVLNNLTTTEAGKALDAAQGKALDDKKMNKPAALPASGRYAMFDSNGNVVGASRKTLWSGSAAENTTIVVDGIQNYSFFAVRSNASSQGVAFVFFATNSSILGGSLRVSSTAHTTFSVQLLASGNEVTITYAREMSHTPDQGHGAYITRDITSIVGIV